MILQATITFDTKATHPDGGNIKGMTYSDTYTFVNGMFGNSRESMEGYIRRDLSLVAGGGYNSKHIENVTFQIVGV